MAKRPQVTLEDLKKSLSTLSGEMSEAQLKRANETLQKIEQSVVKENVETAVQEKTLLDVKKSLGKDGEVNKTLTEMLKFYKTSNDKLIKKLDELKPSEGVNKVGDIRNEKPITFKEGLKGTVAGIKGTASGIGRGVRALGSGILETLGNPIGAAKRAGKAIMGKAGGLLTSAKDVLATPEEYTIEGGRYAEQYSKVKQEQREAQGGSLMNPATAKKIDAHVGLKNYNDLQKVESNMGAVEDRINDTKTQGFQPLKKDVEELKSLSEKHSSVDVRNQMKPTEAPVAAAEKANQSAEASAVSEAKALQKENPEADNIKSAQESMADDSKADLEISKQLLETTKESLLELRGIKEALSGSGVEPLRTKPVEGMVAGAGAGVAANDSGLGIADIANAAGDLASGRGGKAPTSGKPPAGPSGGTINTGGSKGGKVPGKPSLGGKILGGLGKAARILGPAAAIAGTAYSGFQGYQNSASNFDLQEGQEATTGQKISSTLGGVVSGMTFGLADEKSVAQSIHKAGSAVGDFFSGKKETKVGSGASGFPLQSETKPAETVSGFSASAQARWDRKEENIHRVNEETKAGTYKTEAEKAGITNPAETAAGIKVSTGASGFPVAAAELKGGKNYEAYKKDLQESIPPIDTQDYRLKSKMFELSKTTLPRTDHPMSIENQNDKLEIRAKAALGDRGLAEESMKNKDLEREAQSSNKPSAPIIMNNSSNNATTQVVPMKGDPRPNSRGSALDKYLDRTTAF